MNFFSRAKGDLIYASLLLLSALIALGLRHWHQKRHFANKCRLDGFIGVAIALLAGGPMALCSMAIVIAHLLMFRLVKVSPKTLGDISFYGTFAYLAFLRCQHFVGLPRLEFVTNAIQLIITLRVIGLSYEIADMRWAKKHDADQEMSNTILRNEPSTFEAFTYLYSFTGLFTGPYYTYRTYSDALHTTDKPIVPWAKLKPLLIGKLARLSWSVPGLVLMTWLDPVNELRGPQLDGHGLLALFMWSSLAFVYLRMRVYSAWTVSEAICVLSGIGVYPEAGKSMPGAGATERTVYLMDWAGSEVQFDAETIGNLDIWSVEFSGTFRSGMRAWNRTVQFWLANFVYRRTDWSFRMPFTMLVSAFWHGIHPGYFLSFLTVPLCTTVEDQLINEHTKPTVRKIWWLVRHLGFDMMACGFLLLDGTNTLRLWARMYFWLHLLMFALMLSLKFGIIKSVKIKRILISKEQEVHQE